MANAVETKTSFQWMSKAGVTATDLEWLERMEGSVELHAPEHSERVERIFTAAASGLLSRVPAVADIINKLN